MASEYENRLYREGKLGVAVSVDVLLQNISRMSEYPSYKGFFIEDLQEVLDKPSIVGLYDMAYLPETGKEVLEVEVNGSSNSFSQNKARAFKNLAYKILRRKATHGVNFELHVLEGEKVILRAIPVILTREA